MGTKLRKTALVLAIALLVVALAVAFVVNRYRDSIALEVANRALSDSGMSVTDVAVESIGTDSVHFAQILLQLENGGILEIEGVSLPVSFSTLRGLRLHIDSVVLIPNEADTGEPRLAAGLAAYLDASLRMSGTAIEIDEIVMPGTPLIRNFAWYADRMNPTLRCSIEELEVFLTTSPESGGDHRGSLRALTTDDREALFAAFSILPFGDGYMLQGDASVFLEALDPLLRFYGILPENVEMLSGALTGPLQLRIDADAREPVLMTASLDMTAPLHTSIRHPGDTSSRVSIVDAAAITATLEYPSLAWAASTKAMQVQISGGGLDQQPVFLDATSCSAGISCRTNATVTIEDIALGGLALKSATLNADDIQLESTDGNWLATSDNASLAIVSPAYAGRQFVTPSIRGIFSASNDEVVTRFQVATPEGGLSGNIEVRHDLASGEGDLRFDDLSLDLGILNASETFAEWPYAWDVTSGSWQIEGSVDWRLAGSGFTYRGQSTHTADSLAGSYGDVGFVGFGTQVELSLESGRSPVVAPAGFELALVDIGFPIEEISGRFELDIENLAADLEAVEMSALGGIVRVAPFRFDLDAESNDITLDIQSIQLPLMVGLADLDSVDISGTVSGGIPISVRNGKIVVEDGFLEADPPGGAIRYGGGDAIGIADDQSQLGIVTKTLRNFQYEELTSEVHYNEQGDLTLQMRLTGTNPDVDPDQPVILNLGIENNVPQMLRSLQATRSIEEVLENKLGN
jgi:hypothetical protein